MSLKKIVFSIAILVTIAQVVKLIIFHYFFDARFDIIPSLLEFYPTFNVKYSYLNHLFNWDIEVIFLIILTLIIQATGTIYFLTQRKKYKIASLSYMFIFFESGAISAWLGLFNKRGVFDYIYLKPLFIFDLKDVYVTIFICLLANYNFQKSIIDTKHYQ